MDKNRVVTFGTLGGQSAPSSLSSVVNIGGYILKGYCSKQISNSVWPKYVYYGYAVGTGYSNYFVPVVNDNNVTYGYQTTVSGSFSVQGILDSIALHGGDDVFRIEYSTIEGLSEDSPKMDIFTLFKKDENGEFVEALDENGDPIYYAEEHIDDDLNS